jgi:hypothetical protein
MSMASAGRWSWGISLPGILEGCTLAIRFASLVEDMLAALVSSDFTKTRNP